MTVILRERFFDWLTFDRLLAAHADQATSDAHPVRAGGEGDRAHARQHRRPARGRDAQVHDPQHARRRRTESAAAADLL